MNEKLLLMEQSLFLGKNHIINLAGESKKAEYIFK